METISLITSIVAIILAFFAIWQANHHRDQSDKLNRDTTEKLARIEAFATSTKEDAFAEIKRWGDFARAGRKVSEEVEKIQQEELRKLKDELRTTTSNEINRVLETVENRLRATAESSDISEIRKEFQELKEQIGLIQEKSLRELKRLDTESRFTEFFRSLSANEKKLLIRLAEDSRITSGELEELGISRPSVIESFVKMLIHEEFVDYADFREDSEFQIHLTEGFQQFLKRMKRNEMD